jgi:AraC family transcriptional regulator
VKVLVVDRPAVTVGYLRYTGPVGEAIGRFWRDEFHPWMVRHDLLGQPRIGLSHDDPDITAADRFRYDACAELPPGYVPPPDMLTTTIPGGRYAARRFFGSGADIGEAWTGLLRDWLPSSGYALDARPFFEHYPRDARYDPETGEFECDLCIPVVPLK